MSKKLFIKTYGCQMNERDSEIIAQTFIEIGYIITLEMAEADLIILNTCSIREKAQQKVMSLLGYIRRYKKRNPKLQLCVAGCVAQQEGHEIIEKMPHVDLVVGTQNIYNIPEMLAESKRSGRCVQTGLVEKYSIPRFLPEKYNDARDDQRILFSGNAYSRFVTIMQGCNNFCTYCVVPYTRGRESSRNVKDIVDEATKLVEEGVLEITLLGQNVNSYGKTNRVSVEDPDYDFPKLLREISSIGGLKRLRFTTSNPKDLSDDLMRCFSDLPNLCPQFHLPVQAGSDSVLARMNRKYTREKYLELVNALRSYCPEIVLTTDVIVGFPGESEDDFEMTMDLLEKVRFDGSFSFKYSDRPGTVSRTFSDKIAEDIKAKRLKRFQDRQNEISLEKNLAYIGKIMTVLIEQIQDEGYKCRSSMNHVVHVHHSPFPLSCGTFIDVKIVHAGKHSLKGELC